MYLFREDFWVPLCCVLCLMPHVRARASGLHKAFTECAPPCRSFERAGDRWCERRERAAVWRAWINRAQERAITTTQNRGAKSAFRQRARVGRQLRRGHVQCANAQPTRTPAVNPSAAVNLRQIPSTARPSHWQRNGRRATHDLPSSMRSTAARSQYRRRHASRRLRRTPRRRHHLHRSTTRRLSSSS